MASSEPSGELPEAPDPVYARTHSRPGGSLTRSQGLSVRKPTSPTPSRPPSDPSTPSPGPGFRPPNPPYSGPQNPPIPAPKSESEGSIKRNVRLSPRSWAEFRRLQRTIYKRGLVGGSGPIVDGVRRGGRPAIADATFQELLEAYRWKQRVCARSESPRKVDETAIRALRRLYGPHPFGWPAPFKTLDRVVLETFPSYRPPKRHHVVVNYCENGLIRPVYKLGDEWTFEDRVPLPNSVPEYHYLRGNLGYRPLDEEATVAG
jgi:hypothetical protein